VRAEPGWWGGAGGGGGGGGAPTRLLRHSSSIQPTQASPGTATGAMLTMLFTLFTGNGI
jgi:hypothetical protein